MTNHSCSMLYLLKKWVCEEYNWSSDEYCVSSKEIIVYTNEYIGSLRIHFPNGRYISLIRHLKDPCVITIISYIGKISWNSSVNLKEPNSFDILKKRLDQILEHYYLEAQ